MTLEEIRNRLIEYYHEADYLNAINFWTGTASDIVSTISDPSDADELALLNRLKEIDILIENEDFSGDEPYGGAVEKLEEIIFDMRDRGIPAGGRDGKIGDLTPRIV